MVLAIISGVRFGIFIFVSVLETTGAIIVVKLLAGYFLSDQLRFVLKMLCILWNFFLGKLFYGALNRVSMACHGVGLKVLNLVLLLLLHPCVRIRLSYLFRDFIIRRK